MFYLFFDQAEEIDKTPCGSAKMKKMVTDGIGPHQFVESQICIIPWSAVPSSHWCQDMLIKQIYKKHSFCFSGTGIDQIHLARHTFRFPLICDKLRSKIKDAIARHS